MEAKKTLKPEDKPRQTRRRKDKSAARVIANVLEQLEALPDAALTRALKVINSFFA